MTRFLQPRRLVCLLRISSGCYSNLRPFLRRLITAPRCRRLKATERRRSVTQNPIMERVGLEPRWGGIKDKGEDTTAPGQLPQGSRAMVRPPPTAPKGPKDLGYKRLKRVVPPRAGCPGAHPEINGRSQSWEAPPPRGGGAEVEGGLSDAPPKGNAFE